jgi:pimeloyl-ACP methyl ester carboxylesterase/DNA-binding SARP family transcriptional activator
LLGELQVLRDGVPVDLPRSKKTRALGAYLVTVGRPQRRERLSDLFWDAGDDRRASLRWSLSRLRPALDDAETRRIIASGETLAFQAAGAWVDVEVLRAAVARGLSALAEHEIRQLVELFRGSFLEGLDQPEQHEFQAWCIAERERWRATHVQLLRALVERLVDRPEAALPAAREWVRLAPDEAASGSSLVRLLWTSGQRSEAEEQYALALRRLHSSGPAVVHELRECWRSLQPSDAPAAAPTAGAVTAAFGRDSRQRVQFCRAADGVRIAYASAGSGPPLLKTANWMNHLEYDWKSPIWRHLASELSRDYTLVRHDQRGNGLSDWNVEHFSFEAFVGDLEAVVEAAGLAQFSLLGISQGCAVAIEYAVRHPERVRKLVLLGGYARGWRRRGSAEELAARDAMLTLIRTGWGQDNPAFRQLFSSLFMPEASTEQFREFNELQRVSCSPENAARISVATGEIDVSERLQQVRAPTLVLHCTEDGRVPFDAGRGLATGIPGARFVALESKNHLILSHEPAWPRFLREVRAFLSED